MNDPCEHCKYAALCVALGISFMDCDSIDLDDPDSLEGYIFPSDMEDLELANNAPWNIVEHRCTETILDYGDMVEDEEYA